MEKYQIMQEKLYSFLISMLFFTDALIMNTTLIKVCTYSFKLVLERRYKKFSIS